MSNKGLKIMSVVVAVLALAVFVLGVELAYERGHNSGYGEGWNDGTAYAGSLGWR